MTIASHLAELRKKHETSPKWSKRRSAAPGSDDLQIAEWKKQKLKLKEEIARLTSRAH
jgi:hypothetical protein